MSHAINTLQPSVVAGKPADTDRLPGASAADPMPGTLPGGSSGMEPQGVYLFSEAPRKAWLVDGRRTECVRCGSAIEVERLRNQKGRTKFCEACAVPARNERAKLNKSRYRAEGRSRTPLAYLNASEIGALSEMTAASDLLRRGFQVFRALSPSAPCDLVVLAENRCYRVEVKTAQRRKNGRLVFVNKGYDATKHDVLALVTADGAVAYRPEWPRPS